MSNIIIKASRNTNKAPICDFSTQSVAFSHYNNISAQLPLDPTSGEIVAGGIKEQATQCFNNIKAIVESIDQSMDDVIKVSVFVKNIGEMDVVNAVYASFFNNYFPTRTVLEVAALPLAEALIQVNALVSNGVGTAPQEPTKLLKVAKNTQHAPICSLSSQTVAFSHYNNLAAQLPVDPVSGTLVAGGIKEQTAQCLNNIKAVLTSIDVPFDDIVKVTIYLSNLADLAAVNDVYTTFFPDSAIARTFAYVPARSIVAASALPMGALVQIDAVVSHGDGTPPQAIEDRHGIVIRANNTINAPLCALATQTVAFSHYNHLSAQLPIEPKSGELVAGGIKAQSEQCLNNIKAIVESIGHVMDDIVKVNIQLQDMGDLDAVNAVYTTFFNSNLPARTSYGVATIPLNALVQIDVVLSNAEGTPPTSAV